jgi:archaemetzincin
MTAAGPGGVSEPGEAGFMAPPLLRLIPLEPEIPEAVELAWLAAALEARLGSRVAVGEPLPLGASCRDHDSSQLSSGAIVDVLIERFPSSLGGEAGEWVMGLTGADLVGGGRRFVFGEAALGGAWAVLGTARFGARGDPRFRERLLKEALHELGHLTGLGHCADPGCVMCASADVAAVDLKGSELCACCRTRRATNGT